jgi:hypothetical protein
METTLKINSNLLKNKQLPSIPRMEQGPTEIKRYSEDHGIETI